MFTRNYIFLSGICVTLFTSFGASAEWKSYKGIYTSGFENSSFQACGSEVAWWLEPILDATSEYREFYKNLPKELPNGQVGELTELPANGKYLGNRMFIHVDGFVSGPGEYGHMGRWKHQIAVRKFYIIQLATDEDLRNCGF